MRRVIGIDIHRTFGEVVFWEEGRLRHDGRIDMTRTALEGFGKSLLATDEVVIEATGNCMAVSRILSPFVKRVVIANPLQVKAIAHAHVKTDKVDAGTLASLYAAGYLPEIWTPDAATERMRRLVARRYQVVRHRTRIKNEVHAILHAHLIPKCPHADLFNGRGRAWLARQTIPDDERLAIERHVRELDRLDEDLAILDREIAKSAMNDPAIQRLLTITGVNLTVAAGLMAAIGDIARFKSPRSWSAILGSIRGCANPVSALPIMAGSARSDAATPVPCWSRRPGRQRRRRVHCTPSSCASAPNVVIRWLPWPWHES
jgi:transposase